MVKFILGKVGGPVLVYAVLALFASNMVSIGMNKFLRTKLKGQEVECALAQERAAREASELVGKRLVEAYEQALKDAQRREENERRAAERAKQLIASLDAEKKETERRLREALKDKDTMDWATTRVPSGLLADTNGDN